MLWKGQREGETVSHIDDRLVTSILFALQLPPCHKQHLAIHVHVCVQYMYMCMHVEGSDLHVHVHVHPVIVCVWWI